MKKIIKIEFNINASRSFAKEHGIETNQQLMYDYNGLGFNEDFVKGFDVFSNLEIDGNDECICEVQFCFG